LEQFNLLLPESELLGERNHFILLLEQETPYTGKVSYLARTCNCGGWAAEHLNTVT